MQNPPKGYHTVTPNLVVENCAQAIDFYRRAFGAEETGDRALGPGGKVMHAEIQIGDSRIMMSDHFPEWGSKKSAAILYIYCDDTDAVFKRAVDAGATATMPPADQFWGDRFGKVDDPFGQTWGILTHLRDVPPEEMKAEMKKMMEGMHKP
jgi:uncharacterized glyoxalase superfamily protein PhnB